MPAVIRESGVPLPQIPLPLGPRGPFPDAPMQRMLERRWLHYAFLSRDNELGLVANVAGLRRRATRQFCCFTVEAQGGGRASLTPPTWPLSGLPSACLTSWGRAVALK
jgi:hypothetical protein